MVEYTQYVFSRFFFFILAHPAAHWTTSWRLPFHLFDIFLLTINFVEGILYGYVVSFLFCCSELVLTVNLSFSLCNVSMYVEGRWVHELEHVCFVGIHHETVLLFACDGLSFKYSTFLFPFHLLCVVRVAVVVVVRCV